MHEFSLGSGELVSHQGINLKLWRHKLKFKEPAGTSRGVYRTRDLWYVVISGPCMKGHTVYGIGECAPLYDLSCDAIATGSNANYEEVLKGFASSFISNGQASGSYKIDLEAMRDYPSMLMGFEAAIAHFNYLYKHSQSADLKDTANWMMTDTEFAKGHEHIQINGLIWMGTFEEMYQRIKVKMEAGFNCIKLKIGAIDFAKELELLDFVRKHFSKDDIELRVDANGAFSPEDAMDKLEQLARFDLHSIEQPIKAGQWEKMHELCLKTPLPIALDEELIGVNDFNQKVALLDTIKPQYIILKPTLHGGFIGAKEWIDLAQQRHIPYWVTSALESNIGLNAIAQWCSLLGPKMPQGLGTGQLFTNNFALPLTIEGDGLFFDRSKEAPDFNQYLIENGSELLIDL